VNAFRPVGLTLLLLAVVVAAVYGPWPETREGVRVPPIGLGFEGSLQIPEAELRAEIGYATERAMELNSKGRSFINLGSTLSWISFFCTSAITLVLGFFGRAPAVAGQPPETTGLGRVPTRVVGLLAAAAAVLTAAGSLVKDEGQIRYVASDRAVAVIEMARDDLTKSETATEQRDVLRELRRQIDRL
jgi:hypothetical protein